MKRDIDLARQLLLDIEARGADCSVSVLRSSAEQDIEERIRYHLRLLVDAGYLKEIDRTANGVPCLRLTDAGHELIELTRSEAHWRQAKRECQLRTGGLALTVVRSILLEWASAPQPRRPWRRYRPLPADRYFVDRPYRDYNNYNDYREHVAPAPYDYDGTEAENDLALDPGYAWDHEAERVRYVRVRPLRRHGWRGVNGDAAYESRSESRFAPTLPEYLI